MPPYQRPDSHPWSARGFGWSFLPATKLRSRIAARYAEARRNSHDCPSGGVDDQHMRQQADGTGGGKGGKSPRMSYGAQQARGPPAADEKTDEMC